MNSNRLSHLYPSSKKINADLFWGEIAPCEHIVQFYEDNDPFLDALEGFVLGGLRKSDSVILIVTPAHLEALEVRLAKSELDFDVLRAQDRYITLDASEVLSKFIFR